MSISLFYPDGAQVNTKKLSESVQHDLGLDYICKQVAKSESEEKYVLGILSEMNDSKEVADYRIEIFDDIFQNKKMREDIMEILRKIRLLREYGRMKKLHSDVPGMWDLVHRFDEIRDYITTVEDLHSCLNNNDIHSKGLLMLREHIDFLYEENGFKELKKDIQKLKVNLNSIRSVTLGINLNERFEASGVGLISINNQYFTKASILSNFSDLMTSKDSIKDGTDWKEVYKFYPTTIASIAEGDGATTVTKNFDRVTNYLLDATYKKLRNVMAKYVSITIDSILKLNPEFMYYGRWAEYIENLRNNSFVFCKPEVVNESRMHAEGLYNLKLANRENLAEEIITNNLEFDEEKCVYILTGANRGGKTTITQAVGILYVLAGGGIYVPGKKFQFAPVDCIYTHFPVDEERTMNLGRLGEECERFRDLFELATSTSLILMNESFSTTSFEEGYFIAKDTIKAIINKGIKTIYNTHMHKLAYDIDEINVSSKIAKAVSLVAKTDGHERSYHVEIAPPEGISLACDIAEKYGVTYEKLISM